MCCIKFKLEMKLIEEGVDVHNSPVVVVTQMSVQFLDKEATYCFPSNLQNLAMHDLLSEKASIKAAVKSLNLTSKIGHFRHVNMKDAEVFKQYFDEDLNPIFKDLLLEESVPISEWSTVELLQDMYGNIKRSTTDSGKFKIKDAEERFNVKKFNGENPKEFLIQFDAECQKNGVHECSLKIDILRFFVVQNALLWYESCMKKMDPADWPAWKNSLMDTFDVDSFFSDKTAFDFSYISGSYVDYALKKENLLLDVGLNEPTRVSMIVAGLPHSIIPKFEKEEIATFSALIKKLSLFDKSFKIDLNEEEVEGSEFDTTETFEEYEDTNRLFSANLENNKQTYLTDGSVENSQWRKFINSAKRKNLLMIEVMMKNKKFEAIYDSGSNVSLMNKNTMNQLKLKFSRDSHFIRTISGNSFCAGTVQVPVKIGTIREKLKFYVVDSKDFEYQILLGLDAILKFRLIQDQNLKILQKQTDVSANILDLTSEAEHVSNHLFKEDHPIVLTGIDFELDQDVNQPMVSFTRIDFPSSNLNQQTSINVDVDLSAKTFDVGEVTIMEAKIGSTQDVYHPMVVVTRTDNSSKTIEQPNSFDASATDSDVGKITNMYEEIELAEDRSFAQEASEINENIIRRKSTSLLKRSVLKCKMKN